MIQDYSVRRFQYPREESHYKLDDHTIEMIRNLDFDIESGYYNKNMLVMRFGDDNIETSYEIACGLHVFLQCVEYRHISNELKDKYLIEPYHVNMINGFCISNFPDTISNDDKRPFGNSYMEGDVFFEIFGSDNYDDCDNDDVCDMMRYEFDRMLIMLPDIIKEFNMEYRNFSYDEKSWSWHISKVEERKIKLEKLLK